MTRLGTKHLIFALVDDANLIGTRYPPKVHIAGYSYPLQLSVNRIQEPIAAFVDSVNLDVVKKLMNTGTPLIMTVGTALNLLRSGSLILNRTQGVLLPVLTADIKAAHAAIETGEIGDPTFINIDTYLGDILRSLPGQIQGDWEASSIFASSKAECVAFGLGIVRLLTRQSESLDRAIDFRVQIGSGLHLATLSYRINAVNVTHNIFESTISVVPLFSATVVGGKGRLLLRREFAPGVMTIWSSSKREFRSPGLPRRKDNVQAADTIAYGEEMSLGIEEVLAASRDSTYERQNYSLAPIIISETDTVLNIWKSTSEELIT